MIYIVCLFFVLIVSGCDGRNGGMDAFSGIEHRHVFLLGIFRVCFFWGVCAATALFILSGYAYSEKGFAPSSSPSKYHRSRQNAWGFYGNYRKQWPSLVTANTSVLFSLKSNSNGDEVPGWDPSLLFMLFFFCLFFAVYAWFFFALGTGKRLLGGPPSVVSCFRTDFTSTSYGPGGSYFSCWGIAFDPMYFMEDKKTENLVGPSAFYSRACSGLPSAPSFSKGQVRRS